LIQFVRVVVGQIHSLTRQEHESVEDLVSLVFVDGIFDIEERYEGVAKRGHTGGNGAWVWQQGGGKETGIEDGGVVERFVHGVGCCCCCLCGGSGSGECVQNEPWGRGVVGVGEGCLQRFRARSLPLPLLL
jgi:hypothetical protein